MDWIKPYLRLARMDRPIGSWLLLFPCWWSLALAELSQGQVVPNPQIMLMFFLGAFVMRGAGCAWNDIVDRDFDAKVARTATRPIPSGQVSVVQALIFAAVLSVIGLLILLTFNTFTVYLAISSLALVAIYPFAKRYTNWPQLVLGLTFNWGALVGWSSVTSQLDAAPLVLYAGCVAWTLGYDTIYAHQDRSDDLDIGIKSTAIHFGEDTVRWVTLFYVVATGLWAIAAWLAGAKHVVYFGLVLMAAHFIWQVRTLEINDPENCLVRFKSNRTIGIIFIAAILAEMALNF